MDKKLPVIHDPSNQRVRPPLTSEVVDPDYVLSKDMGQQLQKGADNGVLATGMSLAAAYPASGDLCDIVDGTVTKDSYSVRMRYADPATPGGWADMVRALPMATSTSPGLMSGSDKDALQVVLSEVQAIQGKAFRLTAHEFTFLTISDDAAEYANQKAELDAYARAQLGLDNADPIPAHTSVHNTNGGHLIRYSPTVPPRWVDDGFDVISVATNQAQGVVKGATDDGKVSVGSDGSMTVNGWSGKEDTSNKVTSIAAVGSDTNYPTEKAVAAALSGKEPSANKTSSVRAPDEADNTKFPTELAVSTALAAKEAAANKVTAMDADSTDVEYPSAKAVYDAILSHTPQGGARAASLSPAGTRPADLAVNYNYAVPSYVVGANQLTIYFNGLHCAEGQQYSEVGSTGAVSSVIQLLHPVAVGDSYNVYVW